MGEPVTLGHPRLHLRSTGSTNDRARELAGAGAPHGTLVTATAQTSGRGRQGRAWVAPPGSSLLMTLVVRTFDPLLSLRAGLAVADAVDSLLEAPGAASIKWPNDVHVSGGRKVAGILVEGRPAEGWAVVGIGVNVAVRSFPAELSSIAASLELFSAGSVERALLAVLRGLERRLEEDGEVTLAALRTRDALLGRLVRWDGGEGTGQGIDANGHLRILRANGTFVSLDAGEVHLGRA